MHAAPPVRVSLARSPGWIALQSVFAAAAAANVAAWMLLRADYAAVAMVAATCALAAGAMAARRAWRSQAPGDLGWDGNHWHWQGVEGEALATFDLGAWLLIRFEPNAGRRCWIAASRRASSGPWAALRAALHAPRPRAEGA